MQTQVTSGPPLDEATREFYCRALTTLQAFEVPFLIGGAYAFAQYTGIVRHTKDLDVFVRERDFAAALAALGRMNCRTEVWAPEWLGKAICAGDFVDVVFASGNGLGRVDDLWFERARAGEVLGFQVLLCPPEELVWSKAFVMERERYDGADVAHLLLAQGRHLDWAHLVWRFGTHWRVLLSHLILFGFSYPNERNTIPAHVLDDLLERLRRETHDAPPADRTCYGMLLSVAQYAVDVERWGFEDARERTGGETLRAFQAKKRRDAAGTVQREQ